MLVAVAVVSFVIGEASTGIIVALLVLFNVVLGARQELKARASVDALSKLQVPQARVRRDGQLVEVPATEVVPGDVVQVEAGDIVSADGRILRSATLEVQEAALTGRERTRGQGRGRARRHRRRARRPHQHALPEHLGDAGHRDDGRDGDRHGTEMGRIATMLTSVTRTRSPLQRELDSLTKVLGIIAWTAVAFIVGVGLLRGMDLDDAAPARHRDGHLGHPDRHAGVRLGPAVARRPAARGREGRREEPHRRRDARGDERHQHRQDRHADDERDDGLDHLLRRRLVHGRRPGLPEDRGRSSRSPARRSRTSRGWRSRSSWTATRPSRTTAPWSATRPRRRSSSSPPSSASARPRHDAPTRGSPRCRSTPTTSSWRPSTG